ncbi:MAG: HlyD family type I secretion periplasmic adaptor subunit [Gammaproteobacteria bacterium]|nr:HlyD family type I secretion periplasmic adaptor subunit [Gammaproteobacteria bacterium]MBU1656182.1 HlyD family type I secretion periplasmic adaptor subunit [Gammaproteobacteria bacterium]MBU1961315.1 HlyD family type I secretion periplasmic adaptor subunit [Gammaproteobacteria bacterium]
MPPEAVKPESPNRFDVFAYRYETAGKAPVLFGYLFLVPFLLIFLIWAVWAPLSAVAIADGEIVLNFDRKKVQHLEGGIIDKLLVAEGQLVRKGDPILVIRDIPQRAQVDTLHDQIASTRALLSRLRAERDGVDTPDFAGLNEGLELPPGKAEALIALQRRLFETRKGSLAAKIEIIQAQKQQSRSEIVGLEAQLVATSNQLRLVFEEYNNVSTLREKGYTPLDKIRELEKTMAELQGKIGELAASIARSQQGVLSADLQVHDLSNERQQAVLDELQKVELSLQEMLHQLITIMDQLTRTTVKAPTSGRVMDLQFHTEGAVIAPGERILDIVPVDDRLIVEAKLLPTDIDLVHEGGKAKVLLSAYRAKKVPKIDGVVDTISGDILSNEMTGEKYFQVRVVVDDSTLKKLTAEVTLYPGMPVQVFFIEQERTLADYLLSPITDATYRAFREE